MQLQGQSFLNLKDFTIQEINGLLDLSTRVKRERRDGRRNQRLAGYTLAMVFEKLSTRTRSAFETAFGEEGGHPVFLSSNDIHLGKKESIEDSARVFGGMFDIMAYRGYAQETVETLAAYSGIPVINALTDEHHPTQALADLMTLQEEFKTLKGLKVCFVGDGTNNVARSLMIACAICGVDFSVAAPSEYQPDPAHIAELAEILTNSGSRIDVSASMEEALTGAHCVYTDVWVSMGQEDNGPLKERILKPYQVDAAAMAATGRPESIFMHCLPAVKGKEVSLDVIEGPQSRVWQEAENRKHTIKATILALLGLS